MARLSGTAIFIGLVPSRGAMRAAVAGFEGQCRRTGRELRAWDDAAVDGAKDASVALVDGATAAERDRQIARINLARDAPRFGERAGLVVLLHEEAARFTALAPDAWSGRAGVFVSTALEDRRAPLRSPVLTLSGDAPLPPDLAALSSTLALSGLAAPEEAGLRIPSLSLHDLFQPMRAISPWFETDGEPRRVRDDAATLLLRYRCCLVEGDAGSGKSTLLKRFADGLARAGEPVVLVHLPDFPTSALSGLDLPGALRQLCQACAWSPDPAARPWLLLDSLDEITVAEERARLALLADDLVLMGLARGAVLCTRREERARPPAVEAGEIPEIPDFLASAVELPRIRLLPLEDQAIRAYVERWTELTVADRSQAARFRDRLMRATGLESAGVQPRPVRVLCRRPLFLAAICALAWGRGGELSGEAEVLDAFVGALVRRRKSTRSGGLGAEDLRTVAAELAWVLHHQPRLTPAELVARSDVLTQSALDALDLGTGLLLRDAGQRLRFVHEGLQDVLVAGQIVDRLGWEDRQGLLSYLSFGVPIRGDLGVPLLVRLFVEIEGRRNPRRLAHLLEDFPQGPVHAAALIAEVWGAGAPLLLRPLAERLCRAVVERQRDERLVVSGIPFAAVLARIAHRLGDRTLGGTRFAPVRDGWELAVWPVTNEIFAEFIDAGGYSDRRWWEPRGWAWRREPAASRSKEVPLAWGESDFDEPVAPVCGLSIHEARAFLAWYRHHHDPLASLPPRWLWEAAARTAPGWNRPAPRLWGAGGPLPVAARAAEASAQGIEDLGGLVRQYLDGPETSAGYAWCDEPRPLRETIATRAGHGRRWYHPFGLRLARRPG